MKLRQFLSLPYYPLLFACYPVVALFATNIDQVDGSVLWRPFLIVGFLSLCIMALFRMLLSNWHKAAAATSVLLFLFFTYGHVYNQLKTVEMWGVLLGRHRQMLVVWLVLAGLGIWWVHKKLMRPESLSPVLNSVSIFLLIYPVFTSLSYAWNVRRESTAAQSTPMSTQSLDLPLGYMPDIYFIVLDAYGRSDVLHETWGIDNTDFLASLEEQGFFVAECSQSNYAHTILSLTSTLNLQYMDDLTEGLKGEMETNASLYALGQHNFVRTYFSSLGYKTVAFATNFPFIEWRDAEYFYAPPPQGMNEFELLLARTSAWRIPMDLYSRSPEQRTTDWYRRRTEYALRYLQEEVPTLPGPKFVYAHLVIPHHPFVFGPNGEEVDAAFYNILDFDDYGAGYRNQVEFIDKQMEEVIRIILAESPRPPIIVIQGDHGPSPFGAIERRMRILNAYYFPDGTGGLYPGISPVNTFRLILARYFGQDFDPLEDVSWYSEFEDPYAYQRVAGSCQDAKQP